MSGGRHRLWDLPTRLFHWTLVLLIAAQWATQVWGLLPGHWHPPLGYATLALVLYRIAWGFVGSDNARFAHFVRGPRATLAYARTVLARRPDHLPGHNPLGAWGVLALLVCLLVQCVTGLFASDDVTLEGALADRVAWDLVDAMTDLHEANANVLIALIAVHAAGVLWHCIGKRENLVGAMLGGDARLPRDPRLRFVSAWRALALLSICSAAVAALVLLG